MNDIVEARLVNLGFGNAVNVCRVIAVFRIGTSCAERYITQAKKNGKLLDMSVGRKTRSLVLMDDGTVCKSFSNPKTIIKRINDCFAGGTGDIIEDEYEDDFDDDDVDTALDLVIGKDEEDEGN